MKYCKKCVQPDTRPGVYFNEEGVCGACLWVEEKKTIDWPEREKELQKIADQAKVRAKENRSNYDCVIGVSGGKDSTFQALYARDRLGLRPLLVNGEPTDKTEIGAKNIENIKQLGFDVISLRPNPKIMQKMCKKDFYEYLNFAKTTEFALYSSTYIIAEKFDIPLIIQGENPGLTLGVRNTGVGVDDDSLKVNELDTLKTGWKRYVGDGIAEADLWMYHFDVEKLRQKGIRGIWLNYYAKEWSEPSNAKFAIANGLTIKPEYLNPYEHGSYGLYYQLDGITQPVHQMLKYYKLGFGECTDHACCDIYEGNISRQEGIELVTRYDGKCGDRYIKYVCDWLEITLEEFWRVVDGFVNMKLFKKENVGKYIPKFKVGEDFKE